MRIEQLQYFLDICKTQSINESAKRLHISQPALTKSIQTLEKELGVVLFERSNKGIYPTSIGQSFLPYAEKASNSFNDAMHFINKLTSFHAPFNIYALPIMANDLIPFLFTQLKHMFPNLIINYCEIKLGDIEHILEEKNNAILFFCAEIDMYNNHKYAKSEIADYFIQKDTILAYVSKYSHYAKLGKISNEALPDKKRKLSMVYLPSFRSYLNPTIHKVLKCVHN